jgi:hypothetical protein
MAGSTVSQSVNRYNQTGIALDIKTVVTKTRA